MSLRTTSVRARLTLAYTAALAVTLAVLFGAVFVAVHLTLHRQAERQLEADAATVVRLVAAHPHDLDHELDELEQLGVLELFALQDASGTLTRQTRAWQRLGLSPAVAELGERSFAEWNAPGSGHPYFVHRRVVSGASGNVTVATALDGDELSGTAVALARILLAALAVGLALACAGGYLLGGRVLAPIADMATQLERITADNLSARITTPSADDEYGRLAAALNRTLVRLEGSFGRLRRFTADVSHELRTPLTALRSVGEVALREQADPAACRDVIGSMLEETARLTSLVETLLALTRAELGQVEVVRQDVDLARLVTAVGDDLEVLAEEKGQSLTVRIDASPRVVADPTTLRQALINLVDNAVKYTGPGGRVEVTLSATDDEAVMAVRDTGPGIPAELHGRIFEHFYRASSSRSGAPGGCGLGLTLARWAVEVNGGTIAVVSEVGRGSEFRIVLPRQRA